MKFLLYTSLYPSIDNPGHGIFVEKRLQHLLKYSSNLSAIVVAPAPTRIRVLKFLYEAFISGAKEEVYNDIIIFRPSYLSLPIIGKYINPLILSISCVKTLRKARKKYGYKFIDAHYFYPDGVAATLLAKLLSMPVIITGRGTDINYFTKQLIPKKYILWSADYASKIITVSESLKEVLVNIGVMPEKILTIRNGVDKSIFRVQSSSSGYEFNRGCHKRILTVGNLVEEKRQHLIVESLQYLPEYTLIIVGNGPLLKKLKDKISTLDMSERIRIVGKVPQNDLARFYNDADCFVLASSREGTPNVILESLACGTPVVASSVGGIPEVINNDEMGLLFSEADPKNIARLVKLVVQHNACKKDVAKFAEQYSWKKTSERQLAVFNKLNLANSLSATPK